MCMRWKAQKVLCEAGNLPPTARQSAVRIQHPKSDRVGWIGMKL